MTENIDQYVLHGVKHASSRTESTGKHRKCVIWFLVIMVSMQHLQFSVSHRMDSVSSELNHIEGASKHQELRSMAFLPSMKWQEKLPLSSLFSPNGNEGSVRFSLSFRQTRNFLLWVLLAWVMCWDKPPSFSDDQRCGGTSYTLHFSSQLCSESKTGLYVIT